MTSHRRMGRARRDENNFKIRPAGAGGFVAFEAALARKLASLATLPERHGVILTLDGGEGNYFTQALVDHECGAWLEAVSNEFITEGHELDDDQHRLLAAFGLNPPDGCPNHHLALALPTDWHHAAALLVRPLEAVYGATRHTLICVEVLEVDRGSPFGPAEADDIAAEAVEGTEAAHPPAREARATTAGARNRPLTGPTPEATTQEC
jgi:hypothetical protein